MNILVLPASGPGFINQLAIMQHICETEWRPTIILASSGGNVTAYVTTAANWKWAGIERVASELSNHLFIKPWHDVAFLSYIIGYFKGQKYDSGTGVERFLQYYFTPKSICDYEIWTGTYCNNERKTRLFCNKTKEDCILTIDESFDLHVTQSMDPYYANGDIPLIANACFASASIPALIPPRIIEDKQYADGCVSGASPLVSLQGVLLDKTKKGEALHIIYVNSVNLDHFERKRIKNMVDTWHQAASDLIKTQTVIDRMAGIHLLKAQKGVFKKTMDIPFNVGTMKKIMEKQKKHKYTLAEIYPSLNHDVSLETFTGNDITEAMKKAYPTLKCRLFWVKE
jgi:predicted acylesterase/phospholipase RssA